MGPCLDVGLLVPRIGASLGFGGTSPWFRRSYGQRLAIAYAVVQVVTVIAMDGETRKAIVILLKLSIDTADDCGDVQSWGKDHFSKSFE